MLEPRGRIIQSPLGTNMKRPSLVMLLVGVPVLPSIDAEWFASSDKPAAWGELVLQDTITSQRPLWRRNSALVQVADVSAKEAFEAARALGTVLAWEGGGLFTPSFFSRPPRLPRIGTPRD
jgi:hypothetical protein